MKDSRVHLWEPRAGRHDVYLRKIAQTLEKFSAWLVEGLRRVGWENGWQLADVRAVYLFIFYLKQMLHLERTNATA